MSINSLNEFTPQEIDNLREADDQLREIKDALVQTFPNLDAPVTGKFSDINLLPANINFDDDYLTITHPAYDEKSPTHILQTSNNGLVLMMEPLVPIGSVLKTVMSEEKVQELWPGCFIKMAGQSTENTRWGEINTDVPTVIFPNIYFYPTTTFNRQLSIESNMGNFAPYTTSLTGINTSSGTLDEETHFHSDDHVHDVRLNQEKWGEKDDGSIDTLNDGTYTETLETNGSALEEYTHDHNPTIEGVFEGESEGENENEDGDNETAPIHLILNYFLRIN
jgi:hypothetical protein